VEDEVIKLEFWRESKKTLETLFARIKQLRQITQETSERIRRHGTAEMVERHVSETSAIPAHTNDIITTLKTQFTNVHKKLENLEILITAARFGPGGPQDQEYSDAWVEHHFHEYEKTEFERTAVAMGFPPNSVSMEPVVPDDVHESLAAMTDTFWDEMTRVGVAGEYKGKGLTPGEGMPFPLNLAGRYAGENSGLDQYQKGQRIWMLAQTVEKLDIPMEDPLVKKPVEEDEDVDDEEMEEAETEDATAEPERPFVVTPGPRFSPDFTSIVSKLRQSMSEVDQDMTSLEKNYDAFLKRQSPPVTSEQNSTLEAST
jgi:hypothetical protein